MLIFRDSQDVIFDALKYMNIPGMRKAVMLIQLQH